MKDDYSSFLQPLGLASVYFIGLALDVVWLLLWSRKLWQSAKYIHAGSLSMIDKGTIVLSYLLALIEACAFSVGVMLC